MRVSVRKSNWGRNRVLNMTCDCGWTRIAFTKAGAEILAQDHLTMMHKKQDSTIEFEENDGKSD